MKPWRVGIPSSHAASFPPMCANGTVNLFGRARNDADGVAGKTDSYGVVATPVISAQISEASVLAARYRAAGT